MPPTDAEIHELAVSVYATIEAGDLDAFLARVDEDVEFTSMVAEAEGTVFRGHDGVRAWWETVRGAFDDVHWQVLETRAVGNGGIAKLRMSGTLGGLDLGQLMWQGHRAARRHGGLVGLLPQRGGGARRAERGAG